MQKTLIDLDFSTYFKDVIQYYYCQFSPVRNQPDTAYYSVRVRLIEVYAE